MGERRTQVVRVEAGPLGEPRLAVAADVATPPAVYREGRIQDAGAASRFLAELGGRLGLRGAGVGVALAVPDGHLKRLTVAGGSRGEILAELRERAEMRLGGSADDLQIDYHVLGGGRGGRMEVIAVAARRAAVMQMEEIVAGAGMEPVLVALPSSAVANVLEACEAGAGPEGRAVVVHVGFGGVQVVVLHDGVPIGAYEADAGLRHLVERARQERPGAAGPVLEQVLAAGALGDWRAVVEQWVRSDLVPEIRRGVGIAARESGIGDMQSVGALWLCGGGARVPELAEVVGPLLGAGGVEEAVRLLDPAALGGARAGGDGEAGEGFGPALAVAAGVAVEALARARGGIPAGGVEVEG